MLSKKYHPVVALSSKNLSHHFSHYLREAGIMITSKQFFIILCLIHFVPSQAQDVDRQPTAAAVTQSIIEKERSPFLIAVKTNALLDLIAIPNVGLEFYVGKQWSVAANWHYAWWKNDARNWYWRTYGGDVALRRWFGSKAAEKPLSGHHVGIYGQMLTYDFATGGRGYLGDRWTYGAGVEYGYSLPVRKRLHMDFTLGAGYLSGPYKEYLPEDEHYVWQATKSRHWFGPSKVEISLVWLLGRGSRTMEKGGKR